jgi:preprotein translocase subunit YajC
MNESKINSIIEAAIKHPVKEAVRQATNQLLGESDIKVGDEVAVVDELTTMGGFVGKGKVKSIESNLSGQVLIELPNGTQVHTQQSLLMKV